MKISRLCRAALLLICVCTAAGVSGCGGGTADVSGTIKVRGQAPNLKGLEIAFLGGDGRLVTAPINADGTYNAVGVPAGEAKVSFIFHSPDVVPQTEGKSRLPQPGKAGAGKGNPPTRDPAKEPARNPIPEPLRDASTSNLSCPIVSGANNVFDYDVRP